VKSDGSRARTRKHNGGVGSTAHSSASGWRTRSATEELEAVDYRPWPREFHAHSRGFPRHLRKRIGADGHFGHVTTPMNIGGQSQPARNASSGELNSASAPQPSHFSFTGFWCWSSFTYVRSNVVCFSFAFPEAPTCTSLQPRLVLRLREQMTDRSRYVVRLDNLADLRRYAWFRL